MYKFRILDVEFHHNLRFTPKCEELELRAA
jgi:hypothetical protein